MLCQNKSRTHDSKEKQPFVKKDFLLEDQKKNIAFGGSALC
jgi:hypothetical protein